MEESGFYFLVFIGVIIGACIGLWIARQRGREGVEGLLLGLFLGPIGWIVEGLLPQIAISPPAKRRSAVDTRLLAFDSPKPPPQPLSADGRQQRKCPFCAEMILAEAKLCRFCGKDVEPEGAETRPGEIPKDPVWIIPGSPTTYHHRNACARISTAFFANPAMISEAKAKQEGLEQCTRCGEAGGK